MEAQRQQYAYRIQLCRAVGLGSIANARTSTNLKMVVQPHRTSMRTKDGQNSSEKRRRFLATVLPLMVLLLSVGLAMYIIISEPAPEKGEPADDGVLVDTMVIRTSTHQLNVRVQGSVRALNEVAGAAPSRGPDCRCQSETDCRRLCS